MPEKCSINVIILCKSSEVWSNVWELRDDQTEQYSTIIGTYHWSLGFDAAIGKCFAFKFSLGNQSWKRDTSRTKMHFVYASSLYGKTNCSNKHLNFHSRSPENE